jgi:hypothetical protein
VPYRGHAGRRIRAFVGVYRPGLVARLRGEADIGEAGASAAYERPIPALPAWSAALGECDELMPGPAIASVCWGGASCRAAPERRDDPDARRAEHGASLIQVPGPGEGSRCWDAEDGSLCMDDHRACGIHP